MGTTIPGFFLFWNQKAAPKRVAHKQAESSLFAMALFVLLAATAGTGLISARLASVRLPFDEINAFQRGNPKGEGRPAALIANRKISKTYYVHANEDITIENLSSFDDWSISQNKFIR